MTRRQLPPSVITIYDHLVEQAAFAEGLDVGSEAATGGAGPDSSNRELLSVPPAGHVKADVQVERVVFADSSLLTFTVPILFQEDGPKRRLGSG